VWMVFFIGGDLSPTSCTLVNPLFMPDDINHRGGGGGGLDAQWKSRRFSRDRSWWKNVTILTFNIIRRGECNIQGPITTIRNYCTKCKLWMPNCIWSWFLLMK
jgi:hypothetical protein